MFRRSIPPLPPFECTPPPFWPCASSEPCTFPTPAERYPAKISRSATRLHRPSWFQLLASYRLAQPSGYGRFAMASMRAGASPACTVPRWLWRPLSSVGVQRHRARDAPAIAVCRLRSSWSGAAASELDRRSDRRAAIPGRMDQHCGVLQGRGVLIDLPAKPVPSCKA